MRNSIFMILFLLLTHSVFAAETTAQIHFKPGEMGLFPFLEMVSEKLDLQIDASSLDNSPSEVMTVPDTGPLTLERAQAVVLTMLDLHGYAWIHDTSNDLYRILRQRDARDQELPLITDPRQLPDSDLLVTYIIPLQHIPPEPIARTLRSFMPANSRIIPDDSTQSVLITDTAHNISKLKDLVGRLDVPEVAKQAKEALLAEKNNRKVGCPVSGNGSQTPQSWVLIALFSLIALVIGFLARGYVIRRIEGGL
ncbi:secretin N-terminal domain-containing protein [Bdellovibrionota bacterium FG-1]